MMNYGSTAYAMPYTGINQNFSNFNNNFSMNQANMYQNNNYLQNNSYNAFSQNNNYNNYLQNNSYNAFSQNNNYNNYLQNNSYNAFSQNNNYNNYLQNNSYNAFSQNNAFTNINNFYSVMQQPMMQQQPMIIQQPIIMQQPVYCQQPQQNNNMSNMFMQFMQMILPMLLNQGSFIDEEQFDIVNTSIWGDPHFNATGSDGKTAIKFDHAGTAGSTYNVFSGDGYQVNSLYGGDAKYKVQTESTIKAGADTINYKMDGTLTINGQKIKEGASIKLNDGTKVTLNGKIATIKSKDGDGEIQLDASGGGCINVNPSGDFSNLGGIIGTAIAENRNLNEEECNKFEVKAKK